MHAAELNNHLSTADLGFNNTHTLKSLLMSIPAEQKRVADKQITI